MNCHKIRLDLCDTFLRGLGALLLPGVIVYLVGKLVISLSEFLGLSYTKVIY